MKAQTRDVSIAELNAQIAAELAQDRKIAAMFADACRDSDAESLLQAAQLMAFTYEGWRLAMRRVARLGEVSAEIREVFIPIWVEHKALPRRVAHRPTMAAALRVLMRGDYVGPELTLYRGTSHFERRRQLYGFSWTTAIETAREFAERNSKSKDARAMVLTTVAPSAAILLRREPEGYYDEGEIVVDPFRLGTIKAIPVED